MATINKKGYSMTDLAGNKKVNKWSYVMAFIIIYLTDSLFFATNGMREIIAVKRIGVVVIAGLMLLRAETIKKQKYDLIMFFLSCSVLASMALARNVAQGYSYYTMVASLWFGYLYCREYSLEQFSHCYCNIMRIIAVVSLIGWLFASEIISIGAIPTITNTVGVRYKMLFFTCIPTSMSLIGRNMGPFWEPGAYQIYLNVALFFSLFIQKNRFRILDCILFIIACITTKSGAALAPIALLLAAYTFEKKHIKSFFAVFLLSVLIVVLFNTGMFNDITEKMAGDAETNSITYRWIGIEGAIRGFLNNPLFGSTPLKNEQIKQALAMKYLGQRYASNTNTFLNYFAYYGILVGGFMLVRSYRLFRTNMKSFLAAVLAFSAYFISTSNENMMASLLIVTLTFLKSERMMQREEKTEELTYEGCPDKCN